MGLIGVLDGLAGRTRLERERALRMLNESLNAEGDASPELPAFVSSIKLMLASEEWEKRIGGLVAAKALVERFSLGQFEQYMVLESLRLLEDEEVRVRLAVVDVLRSLCAKLGAPVFTQCCPAVLDSIHRCFDRDGPGDGAEDPAGDAPASSGAFAPAPAPSAARTPGAAGRPAPAPDLLGALLSSSYQPQQPGKGELRHGTEGWSALESSVRCLQAMLEGCGAAAAPHATPELRALLYRLMYHPNRFAREAAHLAAAAMCSALKGSRLEQVGPELLGPLVDGMSDSWSQVRYAACVSARAFLTGLGEEGRQALLPPLLGALCLNRYYMAEGVRMYAQQTWAQVLGTGGRAAIARHIDQVVPYYITQAKASSHAVREAACMLIAELMEKVERAAVAPHVPDLLRALLLCFRDGAWPVRDAACNACGRAVAAFPREAAPALEELWRLWQLSLWDNIPSIRDCGAAAVGQALAVYGDDMMGRVLLALREMLPKALEQADEAGLSGQGGSVAVNPAELFKARDNDAQMHSGQDMFSCGSLLSRFSTSTWSRSDGCMDVGFVREREAWEASDGAVHLLREVAARRPEAIPEFLPQLARLARLSTFRRASHLRCSVWASLPRIAASLGPSAFRPHLDPFLEPLFADLACGHPQTEVAAGRCVGRLRDMLGARAFAALLTERQRRAMEGSADVPPPATAAAATAVAPLAAAASSAWARQARAAGAHALQAGVHQSESCPR